MKTLIISLLLILTGCVHAQTTAVITDRALGVNPVSNGVSTPTPIFLSYAPVRVCTMPVTGASPCLPIATNITDPFGNPLAIVGSNFGQLTTDVVGRFSFGCVPGNYQIQVAAAGSNTPATTYYLTCPSNASLNAINNTWTGTNTWQALSTFNNNVIVNGTLTVNGAVTFTAAVNLQLGGSMAGNFSGNPTFLGNLTFSGNTSFTNPIKFTRLLPENGSALVNGNGALGGNWGTSPTLGVAGFDSAFKVVVTSGGGAPGANPTVTVTFADGNWVNAPICTATRLDFANALTAYWAISSISTTDITLTFVGTPSTATSYQANVICIGQ